MGCPGMFVCTHYFNWSPDHWIFLEVDLLWAPLERSVRIVKCRHYLPGYCQAGYSSKAFIYSLTNTNGSGNAVYNPVKLRVKSDKYDEAVVKCDSLGPRFGWQDMVIKLIPFSLSNGRSYASCGLCYPSPPGYSLNDFDCTFYAESRFFTPTDIEVFYETTT